MKMKKDLIIVLVVSFVWMVGMALVVLSQPQP
jgi:hypothetical protein